jgi:hypothetical protein
MHSNFDLHAMHQVIAAAAEEAERPQGARLLLYIHSLHSVNVRNADMAMY